MERRANLSLPLVAIICAVLMACQSQEARQGARALSDTDQIVRPHDAVDMDLLKQQYGGSASVTQGLGQATTENIYANGQRIARLGTIKDLEGKEWTIPADVHFTDSAFPFAPDLYNPDGKQFASAAEALTAFDDDDIVEIDADGQLITGYIFADNYFELYVKGMKVGKDAIPFTQFNSHIVRFRVAKPFTIAMLLVDWEENLGLGSEANRRSRYHPGDGGLVAVFKDELGDLVAMTGGDWKTQTFYTAPIKNLSCPKEEGARRYSAECNAEDVHDGSDFYGLHWQTPADWMLEAFDDAHWPHASTFTNETIGVDNKPAYTNFTDVFDDLEQDAKFIWSTNVILDNEVIVRYTVE